MEEVADGKINRQRKGFLCELLKVTSCGELDAFKRLEREKQFSGGADHCA